jgi:putative transcriptional regulator
MIKHHPSADFLTEYAAGTLPVAQAACVSAHLGYCSQCRHTTEQLQTVGAALMADLEPVAVSERVLDNVLARLDEPAPLTYAAQKDGKLAAIPSLLQRIINGDFSKLAWKRVTKSLSVSYLSTGDAGFEFALYRIAAGGRIPEHDHGGSEMTLVLKGGFADESGEYHPGDFVFREAHDVHAPSAIDGEECICLAVLDAPLQFTGWQYRWMNPFLQLKAG